MAVIEKNGFTNLSDLIYSMSKDLQSLGMRKLGEEYDNDKKSLKVSFEASDAVDSFWSLTKVKTWRLCLVLDKNNVVHVYVSTNSYISDLGKVSIETLVKRGEDAYKLGNEDFAPGLIRGFFINEFKISEDLTRTYSYILVTSDHGLFLNILEEASDTFQNVAIPNYIVHYAPKSSWLLVQRPISPDTGDVYIKGKSPVVCIFNRGELHKNEGEKYIEYKQYPYFFIVNEYDVSRPSLQYRCDIPNPSSVNINTNTIVSHKEDGSICLNIPRGFSTSRYYYPLDLDMIATVGAEVVAEKQLIKVVKYKNRLSTYQGIKSNGLDNTKTRFLVCINSPSTVNNIITV